MNKAIPFQFGMDIKSINTEKREIEGYASTVDQDREDEIISPTAFVQTMETYMKTGTLLYEHGMDSEYQRRPIGKVVDYRVEAKGLWIQAKVSDDWVWNKIANGELSAFSWGGRVVDWKEDIIGGLKTFVATVIDLFEVSVVSVPANPQALFSVAKSLRLAMDETIINEKSMDKIQEMFESLNAKFQDFTESDEKVKNLKTSNKELEAELAEKSAKIEELETAIQAKEEEAKSFSEQIKAFDSKLEAMIASTKKSVSDEEVKEEEVKDEVVEVKDEVESIEKRFNKLFNIK